MEKIIMLPEVDKIWSKHRNPVRNVTQLTGPIVTCLCCLFDTWSIVKYLFYVTTSTQ